MRCRQVLPIVVILFGAPATAWTQQPAALREPTQALKPDEKLLTIPTRPGVSVRVLLTVPAAAPRGIVLFYPGGEGFLVNSSGNFTRGFLAAVVDVPSDQPQGLEEGGRHDRFRVDPRHAQDGRAVIDRLKAEASVPIYVMGQSMGAISAAYLGATLEGVSAIILASSPTSRGGPGSNWTSIPSAPLNKVTIPVLLVHHEYDGCRGATFEGAKQYPPLFTSSPRVSFMVVGGGPAPESGNPCVGNNYHSFFGLRPQVVAGIIRWLNGETITRVTE
jgi:dienelactone hydrolase